MIKEPFFHYQQLNSDDWKLPDFLCDFIKAAENDPTRPIKKAVIVFTPRSGSNWLNMEMQRRRIGFPDEWYNARRAFPVSKRWYLHSFKEYEKFIRSAAANRNVFFAKISVYDLWRCRASGVYPLKDADVLYSLGRDDKIAQAYSHCKSVTSDEWSRATDEEPSLDEMKKRLKWIKALENYRDALSLGLSFRRKFSYEQLVAQGVDQVAETICSDLGLPFPDPIWENEYSKHPKNETRLQELRQQLT